MFNGMTQTADDLSLIFTSWISWKQLMGCSSVTDSYSAWVHLCNKCWTSYPAAKKRLFRGGQDVLWQRGIRASIQKGWKEESHKREIPRSSDRITKKSLYPRVLVIFNRSFTPNLIIIANIFKAPLIWLDFILAFNLFTQHNRNIDHLQGIGRQWDPGNQCRVWTIKQILHDTTLS